MIAEKAFNLFNIETNNNMSELFIYPFKMRTIGKKFFQSECKKKLRNKYPDMRLGNIYTDLSKSVLSYNLLNSLCLNSRKVYHYFYENSNENLTILLKKDNKPLIRSWKEKIILHHKIGQLVLINRIEKLKENFIGGFLDTGFNCFSSLKDTMSNILNFPNFIKKFFKTFPAKIVAIYPSIMQIRISVISKKNRFFPLLRNKGVAFLSSYLKSDNLLQNYVKIIRKSKLLVKKFSFK
jgi:hypothetical protein